MEERRRVLHTRFCLPVCIRVLGFKGLGKIYALNYPGFIAGSIWARSDHLWSWDDFSVVRLHGVRGGQMVWTFATAAVTPGRKRPYEIVQRLQRAAGATDVPLSCGEGIPYTHTLWYSQWICTVCFQMSFSIAVCVCVCVIYSGI